MALAAFAQGTVGFGFALIFTPLASLLVGPRDAVATSILVGTTLSVLTYWEHTPREPLRSVATLALAGIACTPLGLLLLVRADESALRLLVAGAVLVGALVNLRGGEPARERRRPGTAAELLAGAGAGILRGSTGMGGPPVVLYQHWLGGDAPAIRRRMFAFFLLFGIPGIPLAALSGVVTPEVWAFAAAGVPAVAAGVALSRLARPRLAERSFRLISMALLAGTSLVAAAGAARGLGWGI